MIRFNCTYCESPINVAVTCAGRKARCPACRRIVIIPSHAPVVDEADLRALAQAVDEEPEDGHPAPPPPPPPQQQDTPDEVEIIPPDVDPSMETDVLPAEHDDRQDVHNISRPIQRTRFHQRVIAPRPKKSHWPTVVLGLAVVLMAIGVVAIVYWRFFRMMK